MPIYDNVEDIYFSAANIAEFAIADTYPNTPVALSHENISELPESYISVYPLGISPIGRKTESTLADENETIVIECNYEIRVQYSFIGSNALGMGLKFFHAINSNILVMEELIKNNLFVLRKENLVKVPEKRETGWIDKHTLDVHYGLAIRTEQLVTTVGTVTFLDPVTGEQITVTVP